LEYVLANLSLIWAGADTYLRTQVGKNFFHTIFVYLTITMDAQKGDFLKAVKQLKPFLKENVMTLYEQLIQEGKQAGEQVGFHKGEQVGFHKGEQVGFHKGEQVGFHKGEKIGEKKGSLKTKRQATIRLIQKGATNEFIIEVLDVTDEFVQAIRVELES